MAEIPNRFNLRVYAIIRNKRGDVLLSDECRGGVSFTKFPGGGLEFGEGTKECLKREIQEELGLDSEIGNLFYFNDFYQQSVYRKTDQLISFYYEVSSINLDAIPVSNHKIPISEEGEKFRWIAISDLSEDEVTFAVDKKVVGLLKGF